MKFVRTELCLVVLAAACSVAPERSRDLPEASSGGQRELGELREQFARWQRPLLGPSKARFEVSSDGVRASSDENPSSFPARVRLPNSAAGWTQVIDVGSGLSLAFRLLGANADSRFETADGLALYPGGAPGGGHVLQRVNAQGSEDLVQLRARPPRPEVRYALDVAGAPGLRLVANTLEVLDTAGVPRLRMAPPYVVDESGVERAALVTVTGCQLDTNPAVPFGRPLVAPGSERCQVTISWSERGLSYPLLLDPTWTTTGGTAVERVDHVAAPLSNGNVLIAGGASSSAEVYNAANGTVTATASMSAARAGATATSIGGGSRVLVTGGSNLASTEIYNVAQGTWSPGPGMSAARTGHRATLLSNGDVLITGGSAAAQRFRPSNDSFAGAGSMSAARSGHSATLLGDGRVLVAGGDMLNTAQIWSSPNTWTPTGSMATPRRRHTAALLFSGRVVVVAGEDVFAPSSLDSVELYDPGTGQWTGGMSVPSGQRGAAGVPFANGRRFYVIGGQGSGAGPTDATFIYRNNDSWETGGTLTYARRGLSATLMNDGRVLVVGGDLGPVTPPFPTEILCADYGCKCSATTDCVVGNCVDGVCCNSACSGACMACSSARKGSGKDGTCGMIEAGSDPDGDCAAQAADTCGRDGSCDGSGACALHKAGTSCGSSSCSSPIVEQPGGSCDGSGTCTAAAPVTCDPGYACVAGSGCQTSCQDDSDCASGFSCDTTVNECRKLANGTACTGNTQCASGFCVDSVCCDGECTGQCEHCNSAGLAGVCLLIVGAPKAPRAACAGQATPCAGECNGVAEGCVYPSSACGDGKTCQNGACVQSSGVCLDDTTAQPVNQPPVSCGAYKCQSGSCLVQCTNSGDCANGYVCGNSQCVEPKPPTAADAAGDDAGCGCEVPAREPRHSGWWLLAFAFLALRRRQRPGVQRGPR